MTRFRAALLAVVLLAVGGCGFKTAASAPQSVPGEPLVFETLRAQSAEAAPAQTAQTEKSWIDNVDVDKIFSNPWLIAAVFLAIQWFEIWYFNRTGKRSTTIDAAEAAMQPKLGVVQRVLYWLWRRIYFWKHRDKKDPDKEEEKKK